MNDSENVVNWREVGTELSYPQELAMNNQLAMSTQVVAGLTPECVRTIVVPELARAGWLQSRCSTLSCLRK
ncbi:hypothetical protein MABM_51230 (plasmid) [Mycobacteroides abscessus]|uniref:hypothetical protein n=1 Tax=Mycobacteroides abscessus TaxID=36809 RepID=UPI00138B8004|nr:hypothetical protein [Mycobacteroides abscessus]BBZ85207.1 hypothetical protein MABM_51230 [Mycobacteroides abscessus]